MPSKIFEYAASGKPIIAGVAERAKDILLNEVSEHYLILGYKNKLVEIVKKSNKINSNYDRTDFIEI